MGNKSLKTTMNRPRFGLQFNKDLIAILAKDCFTIYQGWSCKLTKFNTYMVLNHILRCNELVSENQKNVKQK